MFWIALCFKKRKRKKDACPPPPPPPTKEKCRKRTRIRLLHRDTSSSFLCLHTWPRSFICSWVTPPSQLYHGNFFLFDAHLQFSRQLCKYSVPERVIAPVVMVVVGGGGWFFGGWGEWRGERVVSIFYSCSPVSQITERSHSSWCNPKDYWNM